MGVELTFTCRTILRFLLQKGSNLPIMLTEQALHKPKSTCAHVPPYIQIISSPHFLCSKTYVIFVTSTLLHSVDEQSVFTSSSEDAVLKQANIKISPEQGKLLLWYYRLAYINIKNIQFLL